VKLVAGLGNPGPRYAESRHNVGFAVVDELARRWQLGDGRYEESFSGRLWPGECAGQRVLLLQPQTYMNLSGQSVAAVWRYYRLEPADLLVVVDDLDLPLGRLRLRAGGSAGGHRGMTSVIAHVGTEQFPRLRIGIGKVDRTATVEYVLARFADHERAAAQAAVRRAADAVECWLTRGLEAAMNEFNPKPNRPAGADRRAEPEAAEGDER